MKVKHILIFVELAVIVFLIAAIFDKQNKILGTVSVAPIGKDSLVFRPEGKLKNFYELNPNDKGEVYVPSWLGYTPDITVNSDTLNERFEYSIEKPSDTFRIITLGDSWTYGMLVSTKDNYSEVLEDLLNNELQCANIAKFEVINLGVPSYDIEYEVERFKVRGQKYAPDLVLWHFINNDFEEIYEYISEKTAFYKQQLEAEGEYDNSQDGSPFRVFSKPQTDFHIEAWERAVKDLYKEYGEERILDYQKRALYSIDNYFKRRLVIFTLPHSIGFSDNYKSIIEDFVKARKDTYFYQSPTDFKNSGLLMLDNHPSADGHERIARDLFGYLTENKLIPCD